AEEDGKLQLKRGHKGALDDAEPAEIPGTVREVWSSIVNAFGGYAGNVDSEVLVPTVLLCLKLRDARTARNIVEAWLATLSDDTMYLLQECTSSSPINGTEREQQRTMVQASYMRVCELYTLHILPQLGDFPSAYDFLSMSNVVSTPAKDEFTRRLDALRTPAPATKKKTKHRRQKTKKAKPTGSYPHSQIDSTAAVAAAMASMNVASDAIERGNSSLKPLGDANAVDKGKAMEQLADVSSLATTSTKHIHHRSSVKDILHRSAASASSRTAVRSRAVARRPRSIASIAWHVVRRLLSQWGFTLFTLAIIAAVLRMAARRFRLPPFFAA
ncbi:hypothetical protein GGI22_007368, partial [Coemansia erecta]